METGKKEIEQEERIKRLDETYFKMKKFFKKSGFYKYSKLRE